MAASARPALYAAVVNIPERAALPFSYYAASKAKDFRTRRLSFLWQLHSEFQGVACTFLPWVDLSTAVPNACASHECTLCLLHVFHVLGHPVASTDSHARACASFVDAVHFTDWVWRVRTRCLWYPFCFVNVTLHNTARVSQALCTHAPDNVSG